MPRARATRQSSAVGIRSPVLADTSVKARTRVRSVSAAVIVSMTSATDPGGAGKLTRFTVNPNRAARTSHATLLVGWFWSTRTTSSPVLSSRPATTMLFASEAFRTSAISSDVTPSRRAVRSRVVSRSVSNCARF